MIPRTRGALSRSIRAGLLLLLLGAAAPVLAATAVVTSGEHEGFSRFVLTFDARPAWRLDEGGTAPGIILDADRLDLDLADAFRRVGRERAQAIRSDGGALRFDLACECILRVFELGDRRLVVDVVDQASATLPDPGPDQTQVLSDQTSPVPRFLPAALGLLPPLDPVPRLPSDLAPHATRAPPALTDTMAIDIRPAPAPQPSASPRTVAIGPDPDFPILPPGSVDDADPAPNARSARDLLLLSEALATAASRGITEAPLLIDDIDGAFRSTAAPPGLSIRSVFDLGAADNARVAAVDSACLPRPLHDLAAWSRDGATLGGLRAQLVNEKGQMVPEAVHRLTRFYLSQGFGAEARKLQDNLTPEDRVPAFQAIADILDHGSTALPAFNDQVLCPNGAALWAVFSEGLKPVDLAGGNPAILRAFSGLPAAIRLQLGQRLSDRLRQAGLGDDADVALNAVARTGGQGRGDYRLAASRIGLGGRDAVTAIAELERMIRSTDATAGEALVTLFEHARATGQLPRPLWLDHAEPLVRANRGNRVSERLRVLWLNGLIESRRFDEARDAYFQHRDRLSPSDRAAVRAHLVAGASEQASDAHLLEIALLAGPWGEEGNLPDPVARALFARLAVIGADGGAEAITVAVPTARNPSPVSPAAARGDWTDQGAVDGPRALLQSVSDRRQTITAAVRQLELD